MQKELSGRSARKPKDCQHPAPLPLAVHGGELELKKKENRRGLLRVDPSVRRDREPDACAKLEGEERPSIKPAKVQAASNSIAMPT